MTTDLTPGLEDVRTVEGTLWYLDPASTLLRRFTAPGASVNTGSYLPAVMSIGDARPVRDAFTFETNGFQLFDHRSAVADFSDRAEVDAVYLAEAEAFLREVTGADRVVAMSWVLRRSEAPKENSSQPAAALVHDDYSAVGAREAAEATYAARFPDGPGYRRALITSLWRVFSPPPQDWPLAVCDYTSVGPDEGLDNRLYFVDEIPEDLYADVEPGRRTASGSEFTHSPDHRWWFFSDMTRDEALVLVLNDSDHSRAWRVPHSAFHDTRAAATEPRHSIEVRSIAYFE